MQKSILLLIIVSWLTFVLPGCSGCCTEQKGPPTQRYSVTLQESKNIGVFEFEVSSDKQRMMLDSIHRFEISDAWVENGWYRLCKWYGWEIDKVTDHHLIMRLNVTGLKKTGDFPYYFLGNQPLDTVVHFYCHRVDTIKVPLYREFTPFLSGRNERKAIDTIVFVKKYLINNR